MLKNCLGTGTSPHIPEFTTGRIANVIHASKYCFYIPNSSNAAVTVMVRQSAAKYFVIFYPQQENGCS